MIPEPVEDLDVGEHLLAEQGVRLHQPALRRRQRPGLLQDVVGNPDLADVVEEEAVLDARVVDQQRVDRGGEQERVRWTRFECASVLVSFDSSAAASAVTVCR